MSEAAPERGRMMRFAAVSAAAGLIDYLVAAGLILCGVPAFIALLASIALVGGLSFIAHETWTFRTAGASKPHGRFLRWAMLVGLSLGLRYVVFRGVDGVLPDGEVYRLVALAVAFAVSAATNYTVSRFVVFSGRP